MSAARFDDPQGRFSFDVPSGWKVQSLGAQGAMASDSEGGGAFVSIMLVPGGGSDQQVVQRILHQIGSQWKSFSLDSRGTATLSGHQGIFLFIKGDNPKGVPAILRVVAAPFGEDAYMLLISSPTDQFQKSVDSFKRIENSFAVSSRDGGGGALPNHSTPHGLSSADGPSGGCILYGAVPNAPSAVAVFQSGIGRTRGYFDSTPRLINAISSKDGHQTVVVFGAALGGQAVNGLMMSSYDPEGNSHFAVVFDDPKRLSKSLGPMVEQVGKLSEATVEKTRPAAGGGKGGEILPNFARLTEKSKKIGLNKTTFPDKTATVGIAPGYKALMMEKGRLMVRGEDGSYMNLYVPVPLQDPRGSLYQMQQSLFRNAGSQGPGGPPGQIVVTYDPDPVSAWKKFLTEANRKNGAPDPSPQLQRNDPMTGIQKPYTGRMISGTMTLQGCPFVFFGCVLGGPPPPKEGGWLLQLTILASPADRVEAAMPALMAMQQSLQVDMDAVRDRTMQEVRQSQEQTARWLAANRAASDDARNRRFESSMANARASRDAMDRSTRGFINYISDTDVVQSNETGAHATVDKNFASALANADPQRFSTVPVSRYVKGADY